LFTGVVGFISRLIPIVTVPRQGAGKIPIWRLPGAEWMVQPSRANSTEGAIMPDDELEKAEREARLSEARARDAEARAREAKANRERAEHERAERDAGQPTDN
jgi:hypothetical protein